MSYVLLYQVYAAAVTVFESALPGSIVNISTADVYMGNRTNWISVWSTSIQHDVEDKPRAFQPVICPDITRKAKYVRIDLRTDWTQGWKKISAVMLHGNAEGSNFWIENTEGYMLYVPTPGITLQQQGSEGDSFSVSALDCSSAEADPQVIHLPVSVFSDSASRPSMFSTQSIQAEIGEMTQVLVDLTPARDHLSKALSRKIQLREFLVIVSLSPCFDSVVSYGLNNKTFPSPAHGLANAADETGVALDCDGIGGQQEAALSHESKLAFLIHPIHRSIKGHNMTVTATARNVTYSLQLEVSVICPKDDPIEVCSTSADDCISTSSGKIMAYDSFARRCFPSSSANSLPTIIIAVACSVLGAVVLLGLSAAYFFVRKVRRHHFFSFSTRVHMPSTFRCSRNCEFPAAGQVPSVASRHSAGSRRNANPRHHG